MLRTRGDCPFLPGAAPGSQSDSAFSSTCPRDRSIRAYCSLGRRSGAIGEITPGSVHGPGRRGFLAEPRRELDGCEHRDGRDLKTARVLSDDCIDGV